MTRVLCKSFFALPTLFAVLLLWQVPAMAHKVNIFAYVENGVVFTESYFPDGKKVEGGVVEVYDRAGKKVVDGKTDREGSFSFPQPAVKEDLNIVLIASMGHKTSFLLKKSEM
jgi:nickel transport protein